MNNTHLRNLRSYAISIQCHGHSLCHPTVHTDCQGHCSKRTSAPDIHTTSVLLLFLFGKCFYWALCAAHASILREMRLGERALETYVIVEIHFTRSKPPAPTREMEVRGVSNTKLKLNPGNQSGISMGPCTRELVVLSLISI